MMKKVLKFVGDWALPILSVIAIISVFGLLIHDSVFANKWQATVRFNDGHVEVYEFWEQRNDRPRPNDGGGYLLRMNPKDRTSYVAIPANAQVEFKLIEKH